LSVFCDELDQQIFFHDQGQDNFEKLQDAIANLQMIIEENIDQGAKPRQVFEAIKKKCAHDLDAFLYDFMSDQVDHGNEMYASELLDGFGECLEGNPWIELIKIRLLSQQDYEAASDQIRKLIQKVSKDPDVELYLEILAFLAQGGNRDDFTKLMKKTLKLVQTEDEFLDLLYICSDYFLYLDQDEKEQHVQTLIQKHSEGLSDRSLTYDHPDAKELLSLLS
jgi:hypothetical protein